MDLQHRIERLERENRRIKQLVFGLLLCIVAIWVWQSVAAQPQVAFAQEKKPQDVDYGVVTARRLVIVDADNKPRIVLETQKSGVGVQTARVAILDGNQVTAVMFQTADMSGFDAQRLAGEASLQARTSKQISSISLGHPSNLPVHLYSDQRGERFAYGLSFRTLKGTQQTDLRLEDGVPSLTLSNAKGKAKILLSTE